MSDDKKKPTDRERVRRALLKKALGYTVEEAVEEYASDGEELRLVKRKVSTRHLPPELTAAKEILAGREGGAAELSDEELLAACRLLFYEVFGGEEDPGPEPKGGLPFRAGQALPSQAEKGRAAGGKRPGKPDEAEEASEAGRAKTKAGKATGPGSGAEAGRGTSPEPKAGREKISPEAKAETDEASDSASRAAAGQASGPEPRAKAGKGTIPEPNGGRDKKISPDPKAEAGVGREKVPSAQEDER